MADQIGECQCQCQADQEAFAAGQGARVADDFALPAIDDVEFELACRLAAQQVTAVQTGQVAVGELQQVVEGEALGEFAEFVALGRADQAVETLPEVGVGGLCGDFLE